MSLKDPTSNLQPIDDDFGDSGADAAPRMYGPGYGGETMRPSFRYMLFVEHIDMCQNINKPTHYTTEYDTNNLVVRRGQEFIIRVTFSRLLTQQDDFQLEFLIGPNPSHNKGSLVVVTFNTRHGGPWSGRVINMEGPSAVLGITPSPNAIVGKFRTYVAILVGGEMQRTKRDQSTDLYLLFNAWCPEDPVFLPNEEERREYVLNDMGIIYQGNASTVTPRSWMYGQFEKGILDACIYILDSSRMPIFNRGNVIKLVRKGSAMINSQDDNGVLVGNWSNDYSMGTRPTAWTGSVKILLKYANTGVPVCFAQCWVFAGVFNTFLRCFGIPSRVITNFSSAHDNTGNLKTDLIFNMDGTPDRRNTRDSIWNYHCWNEVNMVRYDLPPGYGGWQVVDATPQETSDGHYRCGPASVNAIKKGLLCHPFDAGFVLLRLVNSDVVFLKRDKYGTLTPFKVDTTHVGQALYTKAVGSNAPVNVTQTYKYPEGELKPDEATMLRAEEFGCERDHSDVPAGQVCLLGADMKVEVAFQNHGNTPTSVERPLFLCCAAEKKVPLTVSAQEYMPRLSSQLSLHVVVTAQFGGQSVADSKCSLYFPKTCFHRSLWSLCLVLQVSDMPQVGQDMFVTVSFTNVLQIPLENVTVCLDGAGLTELRTHFYAIIPPQGSISWQETIRPRLSGVRVFIAILYCEALPYVSNLLNPLPLGLSSRTLKYEFGVLSILPDYYF
uniref:Transglutaminase-like domain-containing protein n=1 Tax=Salarias fasciatus TaxID=181472 RepID=A0A672FQX0_SALFA